MNNLLDPLKGYKTYIVAIIFGVVTTLDYLGYNVPNKALIQEGLAALGLITLRAGVKNQ